MLNAPLISAQELRQLFLSAQKPICVIDARFDLSNPLYGFLAYQQGHIPNAYFLDLDKNLCGIKTGKNGRHPLPTRDSFVQHLRNIGVNEDTHIIVYDEKDSMFSAHLWWMLLWVGHAQVQVLNGGLTAWKKMGGEISTLPPPSLQHGNLNIKASLAPTVDANYILQNLDYTEKMQIIDARASERYRGDVEPLDPVAGHIPRAINRPFGLNLDENGLYKSKALLRQEWTECLANNPVQNIVHQCGSGVSACHNILAMADAGFGITALYPGSWSEWCANPEHPTEKE